MPLSFIHIKKAKKGSIAKQKQYTVTEMLFFQNVHTRDSKVQWSKTNHQNSNERLKD